MKDFAALYTAVDQTTKTTVKVAAMAEYFRTAPDADKLWCIALFSGRRPKRVITTTFLREWAAERAGLPLWLFEECYPIVGDLAETISLFLPPPSTHEERPLSAWIAEIKRLSALDEAGRKAGILHAWDILPQTERFLFTKLLTGGFRIGVSQKLMTRALAQATDQYEAVLTHKLMGNWTPETTTWQALIEDDDPSADLSRPYPFYLAYGLETLDQLGPPSDWFVDRKWDGIRGQFILRGGEHHLWSRGEELMTDRFPELARLRDYLPDGTVIDGEILAFRDEKPLSFNALQKRIGRKTVPKKIMAEAPVVLMAYDLLEHAGTDIRARPLEERRARLEALIEGSPPDAPIRLSPEVTGATWEALAQERARSREMNAEGLMLKRRDSPYLAGRKKGDWWKWKIDPLTVDAVMIYAQAGSGRRANLFTDFTFAVRNGNDLVPFTKAYSGLTDAEFRQITHWVRRNTVQRFGPVRHVPPEHVFEIAFEGIQASPRHKSGIALRFPRMLRWRKDKPVDEINTLDDLKDMLATYG
ncbi:ATP-dependent DNA ligase [Thalassorhabdomicrobium marinisediminis]|uniref:DNA ligase (ATP) n=1 Tax=Thalassorhabdomicrobium marinisediminis TaxID=2170577 RepID=A0A2T7FXK7_9RHOB|nr:ATP-dependent DNA ligase [Thalassorhabdomicrobium marinisediminis]PVA06897.1 ATP-dependent DNA ligase [Thalassorhabdomicrobium marinisediminis]